MTRAGWRWSNKAPGASERFAGRVGAPAKRSRIWELAHMNHAVVAGLMVIFALVFTSCTASLVQIWAVARQPQQTQFVPPPNPMVARQQDTASASQGKSANDRKPQQPAREPSSPGLTPAKQTPKT